MNKDTLLNEYWRRRVRQMPDKRVIANDLGISYHTLNNKINGYGKFTKAQMDALKEKTDAEHKTTPS